MRRILLVLSLAALAAFFLGGLALAQAVGGEPTVQTQTFTHEDVVTYTIPTETVTTSETVTETVVSTVTVTSPGTTTAPPPTTEPPPTTTEPPPPPPPPPSGGTTLNLLNERFVCAGPLAALGQLPIVLEQNLSNSSAAAQHVQGAIDLRSGCAGDGDPATTDLVVHQYGNGGTLGPGWDAMVVRLGAHDLNISGFLNCGSIAAGAHQDGADIRGGEDITFEDFDVGIWETLTPTCQGAGAGFYPSGFQNGGPLGNRASEYVQRVLCIRCRIVASKEGLDPAAGSAGTGAGLYELIDSGAVDSCFAAHRPFIVRLNTASVPGAIRPVDVRNVKLDTDDGTPDDPTSCPIG